MLHVILCVSSQRLILFCIRVGVYDLFASEVNLICKDVCISENVHAIAKICDGGVDCM